MWALGNIAGDCDEYRESILKQNGFSLIAELAAKNLNMVGVVNNCMWCLSNLCRIQSTNPNLFSYIQPHLAFLQRMMYCDVSNIVSDVCWAFSFLTTYFLANKKEIIKYIKPRYLVQLIIVNDLHIQCPALRIAGNIVSGDSEDTQLILDAGLLNALSYLLKNAQEMQKKEILWILSNITGGTPTQIRMVIDFGFIDYFVSVMNTGPPVLQIEAVWAICNAINMGTVEQVMIRLRLDVDSLCCREAGNRTSSARSIADKESEPPESDFDFY